MFHAASQNRIFQDIVDQVQEAILEGLAPDGGLFMPAHIPILSRADLEEIQNMDLTQVGLKISELLFGEDIPKEALQSIVEEAINFDTPLVKVEDNLYALELFHGEHVHGKAEGAQEKEQIPMVECQPYHQAGIPPENHPQGRHH